MSEMTREGFFARLERSCRRKGSLLCVGLDPRPDGPQGLRSAQAIVAHNREVIRRTAPYAAAFKPNIAFYEAYGQAGLEALRETLALAPPDTPLILDAKRNDIGQTATAYARALFEDYGVEAVTLNPYLGRESLAPFLSYPGKGLFLLCRTSNPESGDLQGLMLHCGRPLYLEVAREVLAWGGDSGAVALVVGATDPEALGRVRSAHPEPWILCPGIGAQGGSLEEAVRAGCRADGLGLLLVVGRDIYQDPEPGGKARAYRERIRRALELPAAAVAPPGCECPAAVVPAGLAAGVSVLAPSRTLAGPAAGAVAACGAGLRAPAATGLAGGPTGPEGLGLRELQAGVDKLRLLEAILEHGCLRFGTFRLKSGAVSPHYLDLRRIISSPKLLEQVASAYVALLPRLRFDRIAAIPVAAVPIATVVSLKTGIPFLYPRLLDKGHGTGNRIEGEFHPGERVVLLDDVISSAQSKLEAIDVLEAEGLHVEELIILVDRESGGREEVERRGVRLHALARISELLALAASRGRTPAAPPDAGAHLGSSGVRA